MTESTALLPLAGAFRMGVIIGWYLYYINRYRTAEVKMSDLVSLVGVLGGGALTALFGPG